MPLTHPFDAPARAGDSITLPVAAATVLFAGGLAAINAAGNALPAADTADLRVVGRIREDVDNGAGDAGDKTVNVERGVYRYLNSAADPVTAAHVGGRAYVEDDSTVSSDPGDNNVVAGEVVEVDSDGVWIDTRKATELAAVEALDAGVADLDSRVTTLEGA